MINTPTDRRFEWDTAILKCVYVEGGRNYYYCIMVHKETGEVLTFPALGIAHALDMANHYSKQSYNEELQKEYAY